MRSPTPRPTLTVIATVAAVTVVSAAAMTGTGRPASDDEPVPRHPAVRAANASHVRPAATVTPLAHVRARLTTLKARAPRPAPEPDDAPATTASAHTHVATGSVWDRLARCESSGNWASTAGRYEGGLQFHPQTWDAYKPAGYPPAAYEASRTQQIHVAERVLADQGWAAWPACSRKLGLR